MIWIGHILVAISNSNDRKRLIDDESFDKTQKQIYLNYFLNNAWNVFVSEKQGKFTMTVIL